MMPTDRAQWRRHWNTWAAAVLLFAGLLGTAPNREKDRVLLRLNLKPGAHIDSKTEVKSTLYTDQGKSQLFTMQDIGLGISIDIESVQPERYEASLRIVGLQMDQEIGGIRFLYDSEQTEQTGMAAMMDAELRPLLGQPVKMALDPRGHLIELDRSSSLLRDFEVSSLGWMGYPEEPLSVGSQWVRSLSIPGASSRMEAEYTVIELTAATVSVSMKAHIQGEGSVQGLELKGQIEIDRKSGVPLRQQSELSARLEGMGDRGETLYLLLTSTSQSTIR
ncbi:hypothetical protein GC167_02465 [bacterium]|nr:hypothetical protein [bacterium]